VTATPVVTTTETRIRAWLAAARQGDWEVADRVADLMPPGEYAMLRTAVHIRSAQLDGQPLHDCPECVQGKCRNCDGTTWDVVADEPAPCPCWARGHQPGSAH
jgi:hypothetical protein